MLIPLNFFSATILIITCFGQSYIRVVVLAGKVAADPCGTRGTDGSVRKVRKLFITRIINLRAASNPQNLFATSYAGLRLSTTRPGCTLSGQAWPLFLPVTTGKSKVAVCPIVHRVLSIGHMAKPYFTVCFFWHTAK